MILRLRTRYRQFYHGRVTHISPQTRSIASAIPWPTPIHIDASASFPPYFSN